MNTRQHAIAALLLIGSACGDDSSDSDTGGSESAESGDTGSADDDDGDGGPTSADDTADGGDDGASTTGADDGADDGTADGGDDGSTSGGDSTTGGCEEPSPGATVESEDTTLTTSDGKSIAATVSRPSDGSCLPGILLVHQFQQTRGQWDAYTADFVGAGFVTLAIDLRGHGDSDAQDGSFNDLLNDPTQTPLDVEAGMDFLAAHAAVDPGRVGVVGTSIGANLTVVAMTLDFGAAAIVPVSPRMSAVLNLAGNPSGLSVTNVYCFAGETDSGGAQADTCNDLVTQATGSAMAQIYPGSSAHGTAILSGFSDAVPAMITWLSDTL